MHACNPGLFNMLGSLVMEKGLLRGGQTHTAYIAVQFILCFKWHRHNTHVITEHQGIFGWHRFLLWFRWWESLSRSLRLSASLIEILLLILMLVRKAWLVVAKLLATVAVWHLVCCWEQLVTVAVALLVTAHETLKQYSAISFEFLEYCAKKISL